MRAHLDPGLPMQPSQRPTEPASTTRNPRFTATSDDLEAALRRALSGTAPQSTSLLHHTKHPKNVL